MTLSTAPFLNVVMTMSPLATLASLKPANWSPLSSGGRGSLPSCAAMLKAVLPASKTRLTYIPLCPPYYLSNPLPLVLSSKFPAISSRIFPSPRALTLLVVVDHGLTKGVILCPTKKSVTAEGIASLLFHKVFLRFGLFDKVISDQGPQFASSFTRELRKLLHYDSSLSTAYHPQSDGEAERVKKLKLISASSAAITPHHGPNLSPTPNSRKITALIPSLINPPSIS